MTRTPVKVVLLLGCFFLTLKVPALAQSDDRKGFEASFYTGASIDSFAAEDLNRYLNPEDSWTKKLGYIAGVDFACRLVGDAKNTKPQFWVYGQTVHGQRSAEFDWRARIDSHPGGVQVE